MNVLLSDFLSSVLWPQVLRQEKPRFTPSFKAMTDRRKVKQLARIGLALLTIVAFISAVPSAHGQSGLDQRVSELSQKISNGLTENQKRTIAVVEFADLRGNVTDFGRFIAEELITHLYETKKFKVIERQLLNKVIAEQKLSLTGVIEQSSAQRLGKVLGVDAIASGTVTDLGKTLRVNARLIDTMSGEIFAVASAEILKDDAVIKLVGAEASPSTAKNQSEEASSAKTPTQKIDAQFFTFELKQCRISGGAVICDFVITNNDRDRQLGILIDGTGLIDDANNTVMVKALEDVSLANAKGNFISGKAETMMVAGVATPARVVIKEVSPQARTLSILGLHCDAGGEFRVRFRNVPLMALGR
jgi:TolB-like protein